jgi:hypothetical protein
VPAGALIDGGIADGEAMEEAVRRLVDWKRMGGRAAGLYADAAGWRSVWRERTFL